MADAIKRGKEKEREGESMVNLKKRGRSGTSIVNLKRKIYKGNAAFHLGISSPCSSSSCITIEKGPAVEDERIPVKEILREDQQVPEWNIEYLKIHPDCCFTFKFPIFEKDQHLDPTQYHEKRLNILADGMYTPGVSGYVNKLVLTQSMPIPEFIAKYKGLQPEKLYEFYDHCLAGKLMSKVYSSDSITYDLVGFGGQVKVKSFARLDFGSEDRFHRMNSDKRVGDYVGVTGFPAIFAGELCIVPDLIYHLSYCLHKMPPMLPPMEDFDALTLESGRDPGAYVLKDQETCYILPSQNPTSPEVKFIYDTRTKVVSYIRHFLDNLGFLKVDSPILTMVPGGSDIHPFMTPYKDLDMKKFMEIAPELYLKHFVGGGKERVYVIGQQFRNDGIHLIRCPEFMCEFYMVLADYDYLMKLTEQILSGMVKELTGGYKVAYHANGCDNNPIEIDFTPPFRRISMMKELEKMANLCIPRDLASEEARQYLADACIKFDINCSPPQTTARLLEKLAMHFLEDTCVNPTFIMEHPEIMSPRAKSILGKSGLTERFQLFINKFELINSYTEENDPVVHRFRFANQVKDQQAGDGKTVLCMALDYGLPTTGAWVLGIDRLTMLLTDSQNVKTGSYTLPTLDHERTIKEDIVASEVD